MAGLDKESYVITQARERIGADRAAATCLATVSSVLGAAELSPASRRFAAASAESVSTDRRRAITRAPFPSTKPQSTDSHGTQGRGIVSKSFAAASGLGPLASCPAPLPAIELHQLAAVSLPWQATPQRAARAALRASGALPAAAESWPPAAAPPLLRRRPSLPQLPSPPPTSLPERPHDPPHPPRPLAKGTRR